MSESQVLSLEHRAISRVDHWSPFGTSKGMPEGLVVNQRQRNHERSVIGSLQEHELRFRRYMESSAAPLWGHPPQLAARARQESLASELQSRAGFDQST